MMESILLCPLILRKSVERDCNSSRPGLGTQPVVLRAYFSSPSDLPDVLFETRRNMCLRDYGI